MLDGTIGGESAQSYMLSQSQDAPFQEIDGFVNGTFKESNELLNGILETNEIAKDSTGTSIDTKDT